MAAAELTCVCTWCNKAFQDPKVLPCFHIYCKQCVGEFKVPGVKELKCPDRCCRKKFECPEPGNLPNASVVSHHQDMHRFKQQLAKRELTCSLCSGKRRRKMRAVTQCDQCQFLCYNCKELHTIRGEFSEHNLTTFLELSQMDDSQLVKTVKQSRSVSFSQTARDRCSMHPDNFNTNYCLDCKTYSCCVCIKVAHANHVHKVISEAAHECVETLERRIPPIHGAKTQVLEGIECIKRSRESLKIHQGSLSDDVDAMFNKLVKILERRREELKGKVSEFTKRKYANLDTQQSDLESLASELERMAGFTEKVLRSSTEKELLTIYPFLHDRTKERSEEYVSEMSLQPVETANIAFKSSATEDLKNLCRNRLDVFFEQADPACCSAEGACLKSAQTMHHSQFVVNVLDNTHRPCSSTQDVVVKVKCCSKDEVETTANVQEDLVGRYRASFCPKFRGKHEIRVAINKKEIAGSPFTLIVDTPKTQLGVPQRCFTDVNDPRGIVLAPNDKLLICEWNGKYIVEMDTIGRRSRTLGCDNISHPASLALSPSGDIFVVDGAGANSGVKKWNKAGDLLASACGKGMELGHFMSPRGIKISSIYEVFVCDRDNGRVQVFDMDLNYLRCIDLNQFDFENKAKPNDVAFDTANNIYITDYSNNCIHQFGSNREYLSSFSRSMDGPLTGPECIAVDSSDHLYVTESRSHRVSVLTNSGECVTAFGHEGKKDGELNFPVGIAVDGSGNVYVCELYNKRIQVF